MVREWKRPRAWSTLTCLAFGRRSQVHQTLAQTALRCHVRGLALSIDGQNFSHVQTRLATFARSLLAAALRRSVPIVTDFPDNLREHFFGYWHLRTLRVRRPSPCPGGVARPQRTGGSCKQSLRQWSPSHPASLVDRQAPLEHHV